jgi:hypothetical protein
VGRGDDDKRDTYRDTLFCFRLRGGGKMSVKRVEAEQMEGNDKKKRC